MRTGSTLLIKMTPGSASEARAIAGGARVEVLRGATRPRPAPVLVIHDSAREDEVPLGGRWLDLGSAAGRERFVGALSLDQDRRRALSEVLSRAAAGSRDELAQLARLLDGAEAGRLRLERLVLSGHYDPLGLRGELEGSARNGTLDFRDLRRVLELFPSAARQVRHLMLATCFRGGTPNPAALDRRAGILQSYRELFPNLSTVTGYRSRAHLSGQGAEVDLSRWARSSRRLQAGIKRDQVFGSCPIQDAAPGAAQRRANGVVLDSEGEQRCR